MSEPLNVSRCYAVPSIAAALPKLERDGLPQGASGPRGIARLGYRRGGSTLVWALVVILVLTLVLTVGLLVASRSFSREATRHQENQAYYTALSVTQGFAEWFTSSGSSTAPVVRGLGDAGTVDDFLAEVRETPGVGVAIGLSNASDEDSPLARTAGAAPALPDNMGDCVVTVTYTPNIEYNGLTQDCYTISTAATYGGVTQTVSLPVFQAPNAPGFPFYHTEFGPALYTDTVRAINDGADFYARDPEPINVFGNQGTLNDIKTSSTYGTDRISPSSDYGVKMDFNNENQLYIAGAGNTPNTTSPDPGIASGPGSKDKGGFAIRSLVAPITSASITNREVTWYDPPFAAKWSNTVATTTDALAHGRSMTGVRNTPDINGSGRSSLTTSSSDYEKYIRTTATARVVTPLNGKFTFNPINMASGLWNSSSQTYRMQHADNKADNVKFAQYNIDDTKGKDIRVRLANQEMTPSMSEIGGVQRPISSTQDNTPRYAYIGLDFTDSEVGSDFARLQTVYVPGVKSEAVNIPDPTNVLQGVTTKAVTDGVPFYPNTWNSGTVYTTSNAADKIDSELIFGNYGRIWANYSISANSYTNYINHHYGYVNQQYNVANGLSNKPSSTNMKYMQDLSGFAFPAVYWGNDFSLYLLDGGITDMGARIMQGVNIVNEKDALGNAGGVIYTTRALKIGGALITRGANSATSGDEYYDGLATQLDGVQADTAASELEMIQPTYHQVIKDTDIIFAAPAGKERLSEICHPDSINGYPGRTLTIEGGSIYIGERCTLQIDSEIKDGLVIARKIGADGKTGYATYGSSTTSAADFASLSTNRYTENGNRMYIKPDKIVVDGGTLNILGNQNDHFNVETDIYVKNGGTLTIQAGAMIKGNIYCYGGGTVKVLGNFTLQGHTITTGEGTFPGGIFIYGEKSVALDAPDMLLGAGNFEATANITISGSDGVDDFKVTGSGTTRGPAVHFFSATLFKDAKYALYACSDHDPVTNQCRHSGNSISTATAGGSWTFGDYS